MAVGKNIKGITIEFSGDTTKLGKALDAVDKKTASIDRELRDVNNAMKFNPKNTELLAQKQTLLGQKIGQTKDRLNALRQVQKQLDDDPAVDKTSQEYMSLRREIITTESKLKHFNAELQKVKYANKYTVTLRMNGDADIHIVAKNPQYNQYTGDLEFGDPENIDYMGIWVLREKKRGAGYVQYYDIEFNNGDRNLNWCVDMDCNYLYFNFNAFEKRYIKDARKIQKVDTIFTE